MKLNLLRSDLWYEKAYKIVLENKIAVVTDTLVRKYYEVQGKTDVYSVIYDRLKRKWLCSCEGKSMVYINQEHCSHSKAGQILEIINTRIRGGK